MLFQRINRTDAEKVFSVVQNVQASTVSQGGAVVYDISASVDGVRVSKPATATLSLLVGIAAEAIADSAYGKVQIYGYNTQTYVINGTAGGTDIAAGDILVGVDGQNYLAYHADSTNKKGLEGFVFAGQAFATATTPAAAQKKCFIKAL